MRVALITGAAQGIGRCIAQTLGARGYAVALNDVRAPSDTLTTLRSAGCDAIEWVADITDERAMINGWFPGHPWPAELHAVHAERRWAEAKYRYRREHPALARQELLPSPPSPRACG